ncbi:oxidoreductase [Paenibacillus sp.]|uniref:oxidoreductase n=1 Tax=Paenibacillus sp. TaxID=58172 RepID=UPI002D5A4B95|nr:oxidoreductase [Paenibacillus sp.]HZG55986.1 oxidoreductase [Paenibacillus sp.]
MTATAKVLNVGLIGYGFAGRAFHAPVIDAVPELKLAKVVERRSEASKARYPWVTVVRDAGDLFSDPDIDLVVVATPSTDHVTFAREALLAGKHVVVEKPFVPTAAEADALIELAKRQGLTLSVFQNRRWDGDFLTIRELLRQGRLGQLKACEFRWDVFSPKASGNWRDRAGPGTGVWYDLGVHFLDQALCLFGMPESIRGDIATQRDGCGAPDTFEVMLRYADGLQVKLGSSRFVRIASPRYALHGTLGSFVKYGVDPQEAALIEGRTPRESGWGREPADRYGRLNVSDGDLRFDGVIETLPGNYANFYRNVYEHIVGGADLAVKPEEARDAVRLVELAMRSSEEGRTIRVKDEWEG